MADKTGIEWADATWSPIVGCSRVSRGCEHCYAEKLAGTRLKHTPRYKGLSVIGPGGRPQWTGEVRLIEKAFDQPARWKKPRRIFVCDMGDLFHKSVTFATIAKVFYIMEVRAHWHTFMVLTKQPGRILSFIQWRVDAGYCDSGRFCDNIQVGTSVEDQKTADERIPILLQIPAAVRFVSFEPLLGPVHLSRLHQYCPEHDFTGGFCSSRCPSLRSIDGAIVGGESGKHARPMHPDWPRKIRDDCVAAGVPFFFKQHGEWAPLSGTTDVVLKKEWVFVMPDGTVTDEAKPGGQLMVKLGKKAAGRHLDGSVWNRLA